MVEGDRVVGAVTQVGIRFRGRAVVLTAGTFLDGKIHVGLNNYAAGRAGDPPAVSLSARLKELKLPQGRLKTGTPPRIDGRTIDFSKCEEQPGDLDPVPVFSFMGNAGHASAAGAVLDHPHQRAHPRHHPLRLRPQPDVHRQDRGRRPALLPERGRQDQPLRGQGQPPGLPGAGRADDQRVLPERDLDQPAVRHPARPGADAARPGERPHPAAGLCHRVRLLRPARAEEQLRNPRDRRACSSPARSTARPATRRRRPRACSPGSTPRCRCRGEAPGCPAATRPTWACWSTTSSPRA